MDLCEYLEKLDSRQLLHTISAHLSTDLEIPAICRNEFRKDGGGKALLFSNPDNKEYQLAANLFGSEQRLLTMLDFDSMQQLELRLERQLRSLTGSSKHRLQQICAATEPVIKADSQLSFDKKFPLRELPALRSWPKEGGYYLSLALTVTRSPETGQYNLGLYRAQILDDSRLALNFSINSDTGQHLAEAAARKEALPVALVLGGDPALIWAAAAPLPAGCSELGFCNNLLGRVISLSYCVTQPLVVPAKAEMIIEGRIMPGDICQEGPFGNHTGCYVTRSDCPVMQLTGVSYRKRPVLPMTVVGPPPSENIYLGIANQSLIRAMLQIDFPQVLDLYMPLETIFHQAVLITIQSSDKGDTEKLIKALWLHSPLRHSRLMILFDADINLSQLNRCWWRAVNMLGDGTIHQDRGRTAIDATGIDPGQLVEDN